MKTIDAVNLCLRKIGESPVTSVDAPYPTLAVILPELTAQRQHLLGDGQGWWFNTQTAVTYSPDVDGRITVPAGVLMFYPDSSDYLYTGAAVVLAPTLDPLVGVPVTGRALLDIAFDQLPMAARYAVAYKTAHQVYLNDFGPDSTSQAIEQEFAAHYALLSAAHTRQSQANTRRKAHVARWFHNLRA